MQEIRELYYKDGYRLVMSTLQAGAVGASYETGNPNRQRLLRGLGLDPAAVRFVRQQHSRTVLGPEQWSPDPLPGADGHVTDEPSDAVAVTVADCMPIFLYDSENGARALLHSGWKGTGIAAEALKIMMQRCGTKPERTTAVLGPSIGSCCYNVDRERAGLFTGLYGPDAAVFREGSYYLSLRNANKALLKSAGVEDIVSIDECTACSENLGSFRREGSGNFTQMFCLSYLNDAV